MTLVVDQSRRVGTLLAGDSLEFQFFYDIVWVRKVYRAKGIFQQLVTSEPDRLDLESTAWIKYS